MKNKSLLRYLLVIFISIFTSCTVSENRMFIETTDNEIHFPNDYGFHNKTSEWVYFSGLVNTQQGKQLAFVFTIFQFQGLYDRYSYPAVLAIIDLENLEYYKLEQEHSGTYSESPNGYPSILSGTFIFNWNEDKSIFISGESSTNDTTKIFFNINLIPTKKELLHGENGYITMGDGKTSAYYSLTNLLPLSGVSRFDKEEFPITGGRVCMVG